MLLSALTAAAFTVLLCVETGANEPFTVLVPAGEVSCFYETYTKADAGQKTVEVFVSNGGDLDIGLTVKGPVRLASNGKVTPGTRLEVDHKYDVYVEEEGTDDSLGGPYEYDFKAGAGTYEVCLLNDGRFVPEDKHVMVEWREYTADSEYDDDDDLTSSDEEEEGQGQEPPLEEAAKEGAEALKEVVAEGAEVDAAAAAAAAGEAGEEAETPEAKAAAAAKKKKEAAAAAKAAAEAKALEADMKVLEEGIKKLRHEFQNIEDKQMKERQRLVVHSAMTESNHESMVYGSIMETVVFLAVSVFQIVFVRRWFQGKGTLLRQWA